MLILQTIQVVLELPLSLAPIAPAHLINWDLVSDLLSSSYSHIFRSAAECKKRFEIVILKREENCLGEVQNKKLQNVLVKTKGANKAVLNKVILN